MKLIRWLFSNILLIVFVLVLSYAYVYWDRLTDKDTPAGPAIAWLSGEFEFVGDMVAKLENSRAQKTEMTAAPVELNEVAEPVVAKQVSADDSAPMDKFVTPEIVASLSRTTDDMGAPEITETPGVAQIPKSDSAVPMTTRELWINARKSFHRRDFETSIRGYEKLIGSTQDNYDAYGELGNVYFNQGRMKEAAVAYYDSAAVLVRLGQVDRAASLLGLLGRMDTEKARQLQELIASVRS